MKIKTVSYKGSKRKLLHMILDYAKEIESKTAFDGFSGTGIVSAHLRSNGIVISANDLNYSSYIYGRVFLEGFNEDVVKHHVQAMNKLDPLSGWLTENYSGTVNRFVRGTGARADRPLGLVAFNAMKLDAAREYIDSLTDIEEKDRNALIFSAVLGLNSVFNNPTDQKSAFKEWSKASLKEISFGSPTLIEGPQGTQHRGDIFEVKTEKVDFVYYDPPYTHGVLYGSCYHLNDSVAFWDKPTVNKEYAIPRPERAVFRGKKPGSFYSKVSAPDDFRRLLGLREAKRTVLSYSDAPRNCISIEDLTDISKEFGTARVENVHHKICTQYNSQNKISNSLKEYFIIIDK
tara:strand:+ start:725 stop:1762 length:1038 start_codon:yes stop_codon:yes gene_type:complete